MENNRKYLMENTWWKKTSYYNFWKNFWVSYKNKRLKMEVFI